MCDEFPSLLLKEKRDCRRMRAASRKEEPSNSALRGSAALLPELSRPEHRISDGLPLCRFCCFLGIYCGVIQYMHLTDLVPILQMAIGPVILISGVGLLLL